MIQNSCSQCGWSFGVAESAIARPFQCPHCRAVLMLAGVLPVSSPSKDFQSRLVIESGPRHVGAQILLGGSGDILIGSAQKTHIRLAGPGVAAVHCRLVRVDLQRPMWQLADTDDPAPLLVNGQKVLAAELNHNDLIEISDFRLRFITDEARTAPLAAASPVPVAKTAPAPRCPSCNRVLPHNAKLCTDCGVDLKTGRSLITAKGIDEQAIDDRAYSIIWWLSWPLLAGIIPLASEAFGTRRPIATWVITAITVVASLAFLVANRYFDATESTNHLLLWCGTEDAWPAHAEELRTELERQIEEEEIPLRDRPGLRQDLEDLINAPRATYRPHQLFTHAFLHADLFHLAGNLLFFLVLGMRVNELIGNWKMALVYPLLILAGAGAHMLATQTEANHPVLGASGAIMGMAGMYLVLFPLHRVLVAAWLRYPLALFQLYYFTFAIRGFWLLVLWVAYNDLLPMVTSVNDNVSHWAHLGGFLAGVSLALLLLITRLVNARHADLLSVLFGKHAWPLIGRPHSPLPLAQPQPAAPYTTTLRKSLQKSHT